MIKRFLLSSFLFCSFLQGIQVPVERYTPPHPSVNPPWFTGPLLAPSGLTIPPGHANIEPYFYLLANEGRYESNWKSVEGKKFWNTYFQPSIQIGINEWLDFQFNPTLFYNYTQGAGQWGIGDMPIAFDFQLFHPKRTLTEWNIGVKLTLKEVIPLGKYQNLSFSKQGTDGTGGGSWQTAAEIVWGNVFYLGNNHFLTWRTSFQYTLPAPVKVKNLNVYGGGDGTRGTVYPAQSVQIDTALEFNLNQNWACAVDLVGNFSGRTRFQGKTSVPNRSPSAILFSLAPAIEYNWSANIGIILGSWFSFAGKNAIKFSGCVFAINWFK